MPQTLTTDILVVGGGVGGSCAAIQAARRGANVILVSKFDWLGGMLTSAGVAVPDGNELVPWQTGLWGAFLQALRDRQPGGLDHNWVSFFGYEPKIGAAIFADWVAALPNLQWLAGQVPLEVHRAGDRITGVRFADYDIRTKITLDGTELGDLLALGDASYRWGWEWRSDFNEPSAPPQPNAMTERYPVQSPTWVVYLEDYGQPAPEIPAPEIDTHGEFAGAWDNYGAERFLNYGRIPGNQFMLNWPIHGNDYGVGLERLVGSAAERAAYHQEAHAHSQAFARFLQQNIDSRYGLARGTFPEGAFALHPYYRESRRLRGLSTVVETNILPQTGGVAAPLPSYAGEMNAIAVGNYPDDHHYPGFEFPLQPKSMHWGGHWTGTPFTVPYTALVPETLTGLLVCEKNISVSHIANGSTRLQPMVMGIGQAAGMAAALCIEQVCEPAELPVRSLQEALITDAIAPSAVIPLLDLVPQHPDWLQWQRHYLAHPEDYPVDGQCGCDRIECPISTTAATIQGKLEIVGGNTFQLTTPERLWPLVTLHPAVHEDFQGLRSGQILSVVGRPNPAGDWFVVEKVGI
ncbi:MAG: FAD-dependent oxidoreductase [Spirulina sp. SIO3F2]|nr:FAD-dependent oxidoreductase [Spirulina sp. SIO3F2]